MRTPQLRMTVSIHEVAKATGISKTTIYKLIRKSQFPQPLRMPTRRTRFFEDEIRAWMEGIVTKSEKTEVSSDE